MPDSSSTSQKMALPISPRGAPGLRAQHQRIAHGRHRDLELVDLARPGQALGQARARGDALAAHQVALVIQQGHRVLGQHLAGHAVAQQAVHAVLHQQLAGELPARRDRHVQLQRGLGILGQRRQHVHRLAQVARQAVAVLGLLGAQLPVFHPARLGLHAGARFQRGDAAAHVDPADRQQLGVLGHQRLGAAVELRRQHLAVGDVARQAHHLLLALQQAQAQALLGVFDVALERLLLAARLLDAQVAEHRQDDHHEQQHRQQRRHVHPAVGAQQRPAVPPVPRGLGSVGRRVHGGGYCILQV
jgi:hypothetical protein